MGAGERNRDRRLTGFVDGSIKGSIELQRTQDSRRPAVVGADEPGRSGP